MSLLVYIHLCATQKPRVLNAIEYRSILIVFLHHSVRLSGHRPLATQSYRPAPTGTRPDRRGGGGGGGGGGDGAGLWGRAACLMTADVGTLLPRKRYETLVL